MPGKNAGRKPCREEAAPGSDRVIICAHAVPPPNSPRVVYAGARWGANPNFQHPRVGRPARAGNPSVDAGARLSIQGQSAVPAQPGGCAVATQSGSVLPRAAVEKYSGSPGPRSNVQ